MVIQLKGSFLGRDHKDLEGFGGMNMEFLNDTTKEVMTEEEYLTKITEDLETVIQTLKDIQERLKKLEK